ncbi:hypothetical protein MIMGU_mgv1a024566mg [Erythranthe guttata]|uniref:NB-ARC domain-containing protein n=1 Tax=Erythranthe guttata TaxID=4155 RepID=A0A022PN97_ERYGU|nr:hypothetical protein MIMGU_mgv1a024566mg [Erythranthe guttata]
MAYGAVGCLELTTERLLKSSHISIVQNSSPQIINLLYDEILSLKEALREFNTRRSTINMKMVKTLEAQIIDVVYEFEDVFDSHLANQLYSQSEEETGDPPLMLFSVDLQEIKQDVDSFVERMNKMKKAYIHELCNPSPEEDDCVGPSSRIDFGGNDDYNMVGLSDIFTEIKDLSRWSGWRALVRPLLPRNSFKIHSLFLRYLIVPDDLWDVELYFDLTEFFPDDNNGSRVLLTTRTEEVGYCASMWRDYNLRFLDKKESWELLRHKVFGEEEPCSYELEKAGKKIAENCEGLPLTIITIANILSKADKTIEYWNEVADDKRNSVYKDAYEQMSKVLYPSYDYLEQHLKAFFLYLGAFPKNYSVYGYQMVNLCGAEGFLNPDPIATFENNSYGYLNELCFKNVIMSAKEERGFHLHSSFWYLCNKEAPKNNFYYALNFCADALQEEVPLPLEHLRLLRVLEARIRLYEFPLDVVQLFQLRYLVLTYDGDLPPSISKLSNLQQLIVGRYCIVNYVDNVVYLPIEIWNMKELEYLQCVERDLPHPCEGSLLPKLLQLIGVEFKSYYLLRVFDHISNLHQLQTLQCDIVNPIWKTKVVTAPLAPLSDLPSSLTKLILKGSGYPWEEMRKISSLTKLKYLTLSLYAFRGPKWKVHDCEFQSFEFLHIEDADRVQWKFVSTNLCLPAIKYFRIVHCYKLKDIPLKFGTSLLNIRVVNCNPMAMNWATKLKEWDDNYGDGKRSLTVDIRSSL